jgi:iron-sulfur cluster repair protein YtfE (RIC family)
MPIRRHPTLAPLSRDHHLALQLARGLIAGGSPHLRAQLPSDPRALVAHVRNVFADEIEPHFEVEERCVMPAVNGRNAELDAVCAEIKAEHDTMRALVTELGGPELTTAEIDERLDRLGRLLEAHVRKEERSLYEGVQETLDEHELLQLAPSVTRHIEVAAR